MFMGWVDIGKKMLLPIKCKIYGKSAQIFLAFCHIKVGSLSHFKDEFNKVNDRARLILFSSVGIVPVGNAI